MLGYLIQLVLAILQFLYDKERKATYWTIIGLRSLGIWLEVWICNSLAQIVSFSETEPKIAQKYIERPVLFYRSDKQALNKFDLRYVILLKSVKQLEAYIHRNFYLRFANKTPSLDHLDDYETHFTVMNYQTGAELHHLRYEDFLPLWQKQNLENLWHKQEDKIFQML
uniref:Uncharacterized protein n=1 Tax=Glossina palpalis gambiensis TaxID=67801 RepID=A0A1B0C227_9MUSC